MAADVHTKKSHRRSHLAGGVLAYWFDWSLDVEHRVAAQRQQEEEVGRFLSLGNREVGRPRQPLSLPPVSAEGARPTVVIVHPLR